MKSFLCLILFLAAALAHGARDPSRDLQPNDAVQREIARTVSVLSTTNYVREGESPIEAVARLSRSLLESGEYASAELLPQMIIAYVAEERSNGHSQDLIMLRVIMGHVLAGMQPKEIVAAIAPYYDTTEDSTVKTTLGHALDMATLRQSRQLPDFASIVIYLQQHKDDPPKHLVRYMLQRKPDAALVELRKLYAPETGRPDTKDNMDGSAQSIRAAAQGEWWEELYAAEMMRQNPKLRDPELIEQLKQSKDAVVRETVLEIKAEKK